MQIDKRSRTELKQYFVKNAIPTERNFAELIDGMLSQRDDGIAKLPNDPLSIEAMGDDAGQQKVLQLYRSFSDASPSWVLSLNPRQNPADPATARAGFSISDGSGTSRLFIDRDTGNVGIGTFPSGAKLQVAGSAIFADSVSAPALLLLGKTALSGDDNSLRLNQDGDFNFVYTPGRFEAASGVKAREIGLGTQVHGTTTWPFETIQMHPENNLRIWYGTVERFLFGNTGYLQANAFRGAPADWEKVAPERIMGTVMTDNVTYKAMMIVGSDQGQGRRRWVRLWDYLTVHGELTAEGGVQAQKKLSAVGNAGVLDIQGTDHAYIQWYPMTDTSTGTTDRKGWIGYGNRNDLTMAVTNEAGELQLAGKEGVRVNGAFSAPAGALLNAIGIGTQTYGSTKCPYETIQMHPEHNLRIWYGTAERFLFGNTGYLQANAFRGAPANWNNLASDGLVMTDNVDYKAMMIVGSDQDQGKRRWVRLWDYLTVHGAMTADGEIRSESAFIKIRGATGEEAFVGAEEDHVMIGCTKSSVTNVVAWTRADKGHPIEFTCLKLHETSDARLKENIEPVAGALDKVSRLRGVWFDWKNQPADAKRSRNLGLVAQEVKEVVPEAVTEGMGGYLAISYQSMTVLLLEAMKEQQKQIDELRRQGTQGQ